MSTKPAVAAICFSLALFMLLFMVWPQYQKLQDVNAKVDKAQTRLQQRKDYVNELQSLSKRLKEHEKEMKKVESVLPSKPSLSSLLRFLSKASNDHGLQLKNVGGLSKTSLENNVEKVEVNLTLIGSYSAFKNFVKAVEKSSRIIEVETVNFRMPEQQEEERKRRPKFKLKFSTHYYTP